MKLIFFVHIIFCLFLTAYSCNQETNRKYDELTHIEVNFVSKDILTPFATSCDNFEPLFENTYKTLVIEDAKDIESVKTCLNKSKIISKPGEIDVRVKVYLYDKNKSIIAIICFDRFGNLVLNNKDYLKNKCFTDFINKKVDK